MKKNIKKICLIWGGFILSFLLALFVGISIKSPSLERDWALEDSLLPTAVKSLWEEGVIYSIKNIRDFNYRSKSDFDVKYYDETYDLSKLEKLYYIVVPFSNFEWPAHTMLSFQFSDGKTLVASAETRKEKGESFSAVKWILNEFEFFYVLWSEEDLIKLRTDYRDNDVYMYPIRAEKDDIAAVFKNVMNRINKLSEEPEFYHTFFNNCTTTILDNANDIRNEKIPFSFEAILPAYSDKVVYDLGLIDTDLSFDEAKKYYKIDGLVQGKENIDFSKEIRIEKK